MDNKYRAFFLSKKVLFIWVIIQTFTLIIWLIIGYNLSSFFDYIFLDIIKVTLGYEPRFESMLYICTSSVYFAMNTQIITFRIINYIIKHYFED